MRMEVIITGFPGKTAQGSLSWSSVVYLESGGKKILFDTGGPSKRRSIIGHLARIGIDANDIDYLVFSHFHDDHVRNYDYFPNAEYLLHAVDAAWADTNPVDNFAFPAPYYKDVKKSGRLTLIHKDEEIFPGVFTMLVPGHTPGCMALVLRNTNSPVTVLAADAVKNMAELALLKVGDAYDIQASIDSIKRIRDIADIVVTGHDRILRVTPTHIIAECATSEKILIPAGVGGQDSMELELFVGKNSCPRT